MIELKQANRSQVFFYRASTLDADVGWCLWYLVALRGAKGRGGQQRFNLMLLLEQGRLCRGGRERGGCKTDVPI